MKIIETELNIGVAQPFSVIHMADTHFTLADERDDAKKRWLGEDRAAIFPEAMQMYEAAKKLSHETGYTIVHTGDFIDFVSEANLDMTKRFIEECDVFYAAGNHDFSLYCGEAWEDADYRNRSLAKVQACHKNDIRMSSRVIGGVNFIALDDGYYRFDREHIDFVKAEVRRGLPIVLVIHKPMYDPQIYTASAECHHNGALVGIPDEYSKYWDDERRREICPDDITRDAVEYFKSESQIKALICGHFHLNYEGVDESGRPVLLTDTKTLRIIRFI